MPPESTLSTDRAHANSVQPPAATSGFCIDCGYSLAGLSSRRCPECGRAFDPNDLKTMRARPRSGISRRLLRWAGRRLGRPVGIPIIGAALLATVGVLSQSRC